ncbi:uncharacterized protein [Dermacentor albipictus]|uniref:uncharacterized protein isoform X1 n=1 Tax=Dermacentor albipictus TaxID=60249 RepID=UPI0038FC8FF8
MARNFCLYPVQAAIGLLLALSTDTPTGFECVSAHLPGATCAYIDVDAHFPAVVSSTRLVFRAPTTSTTASSIKAHLNGFPGIVTFSGHSSSTFGMARNFCLYPVQAAIGLLLALSTDTPTGFECVSAHLPGATCAYIDVDAHFPAVVSSTRLVFRAPTTSTTASSIKAHLNGFPGIVTFSGHSSSTFGMARNFCLYPVQIRTCIVLALATSAFAGFVGHTGFGVAHGGYGLGLAAAPAVATVAHAAPVATVAHAAPVATFAHAAPVATYAAAPVATAIAAPAVATYHAAPAVATFHAAPAVTAVHAAPALATTAVHHAPAVATVAHAAPAFAAYHAAPAYYGYGDGTLGYGGGHYGYGHGLLGYGLNYGYGLGTPFHYGALLRKK